ncbi:MAG: hypothetical protein CUN51_06050 [Candidatus Thermofonsia Clade 1 bacterium]|uniref:Uncharacterized protein n=1 Tax=Candidatus Thermofonsia Clade 1 bacterium TaxID=2364210 RepID=A0A2M8P0G7_9CHLR|nr:MAG: hypothetical protein CUN51_06050 [Candidatus Thermofonsia Clade 1 bacterium]
MAQAVTPDQVRAFRYTVALYKAASQKNTSEHNSIHSESAALEHLRRYELGDPKIDPFIRAVN